jgi:hypothetical protein
MAMTTPYKSVDYIIANAPKFAKAKSERTYIENFLRTKKAFQCIWHCIKKAL